MSMRVLILSASMGTGHNRAAWAIQKGLESLNLQVESEVVDTLRYISPAMERVASTAYLQTLKHRPEIWGYIYDHSDRLEKNKVKGVLAHAAGWRLVRLIESFKPDVIACTFHLSCGAVASLKSRGLKTPVVGVVTDFDLHNYWLFPGLDRYLVAIPQGRNRLLNMGYRPNQVLATGIPIDPHFADDMRQQEVKLKYGMDPNRPVVLVTGGGLGLGPVSQVVGSLLRIPGAQVLVAVGSNRQLALTLAEGGYGPDLHVIGYTQAMPELMRLSDLLVSKAGGLTCSEALACGLPMVLMEYIPGQEAHNGQILAEQGVALRARLPQDVARLAESLLGDPKRMKAMHRKALHLGRPFSAQKAAKVIVELAQGGRKP